MILFLAVFVVATPPRQTKQSPQRYPPRYYNQRQQQQQQQEQSRWFTINERSLQQQPQQQLENDNDDNNNNNDTTSSFAEQELRTALLRDYDRGSFPFSAWHDTLSSTTTTNKRTGMDVQLGLNFHRVLSVDPTNSVVDFIVWVRQSWRDERLAWNQQNQQNQQYANITTLRFWIADGSGAAGETSEIWTPDLELWNLQVPLAESLADAYAVVRPDGTVFWSRPGHVQPVCKFDGLQDFPFDTLHCTLEIGSWAFSGLYLRPVPMDGVGYSIGGSQTAGEAFAEFSLQSVQCEQHIYPPYIGAPDEDWPVLFYHVTLKRASQPYARGFIMLQLVLNLVAFSAFWLPPHVGERMSLAITALLAAVASELVVAAKLPAAAELTWFAKFSLVSLLFTAAALFESAAVIYFHYCTDDDLVPTWVRWFWPRSKGNQTEETRQQQTAEMGNGIPSPQDVEQDESNNKGLQNGEHNHNHRQQHDKVDPRNSDAEVEELDPRDEMMEKKNVSFKDSQSGDPHGSAFGNLSEISQSENFGQPGTRQRVNRPAMFSGSFKKEMASFRTRQGIKTILGRDADDFRNAKEMENNARWQRVAKKLDEISRLTFPVAFAIFLAVIFANR